MGGGNFPLIRFNGFNGEWMMLKIGEIGYTYSSLTGKGKNDFGQGNAQFITFMNVLTNTHIDPTTFQKVVVNEGEMQNPVCKGDLLFNTSSETPEEVGMCSVLDHDIPNLYLNSFCFGYRLTEERVLPSYVVYLMRSTIGRQMMTLLAQGATRYNLPKREFYKAEIPVPPTIEEQKRIASFFRSLDTKISLQTQRIEKLKQMKAACLSKMIA